MKALTCVLILASVAGCSHAPTPSYGYQPYTPTPVSQYTVAPVRATPVRVSPAMVAQHIADVDAWQVQMQIAAIDARVSALESK